MNWQVKYALENISKQPRLSAEQVNEELIRVSSADRPDVLAAVSGGYEIDAAAATSYLDRYPKMDFLCGYRTDCVWRGQAIELLERANVGWGNSGTLTSAALDGDANTASHKTYRFSDRLLRQYGRVKEVRREYDRVHQITLWSGTVLRIGMLADYEPTADSVRSLWETFGPLDLIWNVNPNGSPSPEAVDAARQLGCDVLKWEELRERLRIA